MHHNNVSFTDEKAFILSDLLKQHLRIDPLTGSIPQTLIPSEVSIRKRYNMMYSTKPFRTTKIIKILRCVISEENGTAGMFQRCKHFLVHTGFLVPDDMTVCDDAAMYAKGDNYYSK